MKQTRMKTAIYISLLIHVFVFCFMYFYKPSEVLQREVIEVSFDQPTNLKDSLDSVEKSDQKDESKQIVEQSEHSINEEKPDKNYLLSAKNQKVAEETRAALNGKFKNANTGAGKPQNMAREQVKSASRAQETAKQLMMKPPVQEEDILPILKTKNGMPTLQALKPKFNWNPAASNAVGLDGTGEASQSNDYLKDKKVGGETILNTREFVYYSYYNRIKNQLEQYWGTKIREKMKKIYDQGRAIASESDKITKVIITLDKKGVLMGVQVVSNSGVKDLDDAAIEAFRAAAPFPNPPAGIVEPDGTIKIRWDFVIEA